MIARRLLQFLLVSSLLASPVFAQTACAPEKLSAAIDAYSSDPFGVAAWRKMTGLGDPGLEGSSYAYDGFEIRDAWKKLVNEVAPDLQNVADVDYNCRMGYPLQVLQERIAKFGKSSNYVKLWLRGQEAAIAACSGRTASVIATPPGLLKPDEETLFKDDSAYQKASAAFYTDKTSAAQQFKMIGASNSPHKAAARYNLANLLANAKNVVEARTEAKAILADSTLVSAHDITRELLGYIANIEDTAQGWTELIDTEVKTLSQPLAAITATDKSKAAYMKALYDIGYAGVTDKQDDWWVTNTLPADPTLSKALADAARKHPMVLWMMAGQSVNKPYGQAPWALVGDTWQAWSASYVDRAQALQSIALPDLPKRALESLKAKPDEASRARLWTQALDAAMKTNASCGDAPDTAALTLLTLQAVRLSAMAKRFDEIYDNLPKLKLDGSTSLTKVILPKLMQHILASGNVGEGRRLRDRLLTDSFLASFTGDTLSDQRDVYARFLASVAEDEVQWVEALTLMTEKLSPPLLNLLPASTLRKIGENTGFSAEQRALLKRAAWVRNYVTGARNSDKTTADMFAANPELAAARDAVAKEFPNLKPDRVLLLTILRNPRFGMLLNSPDWSDPIEARRDVFNALDETDPNDKNWWCPLETDRQLGAIRRDLDEATLMGNVRDYDGKDLAPLLDKDAIIKADQRRDAVLRQHPMIKAVDWTEVSRLAKAPSAPQLLAKSAMGWAKASRGDDGAPEALALAVRATRYGCRWHGSVKAYSKPAQELLKAKFPTTTWSTQTPYWFDCTDEQYDAEYKKLPGCKPRTWAKQAPLK